MSSEPAFYPETELEDHGLTPDTWDTAAVYALKLDVRGVLAFRERWHSVYEIDPPHDLTGDLSITRKSGYIQHGNVGYATEGFDPDSTPVMTLGDGDKRFYGTMLLPVSELSEEAREAIEEREVAPDAD